MYMVGGRVNKQGLCKLPFGYYLERDADLLILCRSDGSFVAAFTVKDVDLFELEVAVWEDAD